MPSHACKTQASSVNLKSYDANSRRDAPARAAGCSEVMLVLRCTSGHPSAGMLLPCT